MAINSCSINAHTINALACRRRSFAPTPVQQTEKGHVYHHRYKNWEEREEQDFAVLDSTTVLLTVSINGKTIEKSFDNLPDQLIPMIAVTNLNASLVVPELQITNLKINRKK